MNTVIQHGPEFDDFRASAPPPIQQLEQQRLRIEAELRAVNNRLISRHSDTTMSRSELLGLSTDLNLLLANLNSEINAQRGRRRQV